MRKSLDQRKSVARVPQGHLSAELAPPVPRPSSRPWQRDNKWPYCCRWLTPTSSMPVSGEGIALQPKVIWCYGHTSEPSQYWPGFIWGGGGGGGGWGVTRRYFTPPSPLVMPPSYRLAFSVFYMGVPPLNFYLPPVETCCYVFAPTWVKSWNKPCRLWWCVHTW